MSLGCMTPLKLTGDNLIKCEFTKIAGLDAKASPVAPG